MRIEDKKAALEEMRIEDKKAAKEKACEEYEKRLQQQRKLIDEKRLILQVNCNVSVLLCRMNWTFIGHKSRNHTDNKSSSGFSNGFATIT